MKFTPAITLVALLAAAGCAANPQSSSTQMAPASAGGAAAMPQSPNSLPPGDVVNAPRARATGAVSTTVPGRAY